MLGSIACSWNVPTSAQQGRRDVSPLDLPRPGYERTWTRVGPAELRIDADLSALYDSNVYATSRNPNDDVVLRARAGAELTWRSGNAELLGDVHAETRRFIKEGRESATSFGASLRGRLAPGRDNALSAELGFERAIESRADPEARASTLKPPRKINFLTAELAYARTGPRLGLDLSGGIQKFDFLDPAERDRDFMMFRGSGRVTLRPSAPLSLFVEGYVARRDFGTRTDLSGINRDATTFGLLGGVSREVSARMRGRIGAGIFRFHPDDPTLAPYSGFALSGELTWNPRVRTAVTAQLFRGDVATARSGATGRTDTRFSVRVDQEAYHNILLHGRAGWTRSAYRGPGADRLTTWSLALEGEYLISRCCSIFIGADVARRTARDPLDEFSRFRAEIGHRLRF